MRRTTYQRRAAALRRVSLAVDRQIRATSPAEKARAGQWVLAWAAIASIRPR